MGGSTELDGASERPSRARGLRESDRQNIREIYGDRAERWLRLEKMRKSSAPRDRKERKVGVIIPR